MPPSSVARAVSAAFNDAQRSTATHKRASRALVAAYAADPTAFLDAFLHALNRALVVFAREPAVERVVAFVATFAAQRSDPAAVAAEAAAGASFSTLVLRYLLEQSGAASKAVRFRCCQTLSAALAALPEDADIDDDVWEPLQAALLARACDRLPRVRAAAAGALCRLQTTGDPVDDAVAATLVALLTADSSASVRKAALAAVAVTPATLPAVIRRTRDVKEDVRRAAYGVLAARMHPEELALGERVGLLRGGLRDRAPAVRAVAAEEMLVSGWLEGACEGDVFDLVELLGGLEYEEDVLLALRIVFSAPRRKPLLDAIQIDVNNLTAMDVVVLRAMCDVKAAAERLEEIIPSTTDYAEVLKYYATVEFACRNLLAISRRVDLADEAGRRALEAALRDCFLTSTEVCQSVIPDAVAAMRRTMLSEDAACRALVEIVLNDVLQPRLDGETGGEAQGETDNRTEEWVSMRALGITKELLRHATPVSSIADSGNGLFLSLVQLVVIPRLTSPDGGQRHAALECLALFCLLDSSGTEARRHVPLFVQASRNDNEEIQVLALRILADMFMVFDFSASIDDGFAKPAGGSIDDGKDTEDEDDFFSANGDSPDKNTASGSSAIAAAESPSPSTQVVSLLCDYITHVDGTLRTAAAEALATLLFSRRVLPSAVLLSRLLLAYYNPVNEDNETMRQCLSVFFPAFAFSAPQHRVALESAFLPTLRVLLDAPSKSPLSAVPKLAVAQFLLHLTNPASVPASGKCVSASSRDASQVDIAYTAATTHERLAEALLHQLLDQEGDGENEECRLFSKIMSSIRLISTGDNDEALQRLWKLAVSSVDSIQDKRSLIQLRKFEKQLNSLTRGMKDVHIAGGAGAGGNGTGEVDGGDEPEAGGRVSEEQENAPLPVDGEVPLPAKKRAKAAPVPRKSSSPRGKPAKRNPPRKSAPLAERVLNLSEEDDESAEDAEAAEVIPASRAMPRRATRVRKSYVEVIDIDLESEEDAVESDSDESYGGID